MGRQAKSLGLAPPAVRKDLRAKQARYIVHNIIPGLLAASKRAKAGADGSRMYVNPELVRKSGGTPAHRGEDDIEAVEFVKRKGQGKRRAKSGASVGSDEVVIRHEDDMDEGRLGGKKAAANRKVKEKRIPKDESHDIHLQGPSGMESSSSDHLKVRIVVTDALTAARRLAFPDRRRPEKQTHKPCILNSASPLNPGGGLLNGSTSPESFLCLRTTLYSSLKDEFYRLPDIGGVYTDDVLVFRDSSPLGEALGGGPEGYLGKETEKGWWVDVVSAGMLRFPDLDIKTIVETVNDDGEDKKVVRELKKLSKKDARSVEQKIRGVLRICQTKGVKQLVAGAWGCEGYGNPVKDVAEAWRRVLLGEDGTAEGAGVQGAGPKTKSGKGSQFKKKENWDPLVQVTFAIPSRRMAREFAHSFGSDVLVEEPPDTIRTRHGNEEEDGDDSAAEELRSKIREMEGQMGSVWNKELKDRMGVILEGLRSQLKEMDGADGGSDHRNSPLEDVEGTDDEEGAEHDIVYSDDDCCVRQKCRANFSIGFKHQANM